MFPTTLLKKKVVSFRHGKRKPRPPTVRGIASRIVEFDRLLSQLDLTKGEIVECGVGQGKSLTAILSVTEAYGMKAEVWALDSFAGFPEATPHDEGGKVKCGPIKPNYKKYNTRWVRTRLRLAGFSDDEVEERVHFVEGFFPDSFRGYHGREVVFLHVDVDLYQSHVDVLSYFWDKVVDGGIVLFDDYGSAGWPGAKRAVDEFIARHDLKDCLFVEKVSKKYYLKKGCKHDGR